MLLLSYIEVGKFVHKIMANSNDHLRSFLCPELWQWCQSDDEDENKGTNLPLQASNEF